jgi:hypothetical protein
MLFPFLPPRKWPLTVDANFGGQVLFFHEKKMAIGLFWKAPFKI